MATGQIETTVKLAGVSATMRATRTATGSITHDPVLPAGKAGTLTTRTDDDTGVATLGAGHGVTTDDTVDVYWDGGLRYGMSVTVVDGVLVTIDLGAGDNLPTQDTALVVTPRVEIDTDFDGDLLKMIAASTDKRAHVEFLTEADVSIHAVELVDSEGWCWIKDQGVSNPLTGDPVGKAQASCGVATAGTILTVGVLYDSAP